MLLVKRAEQHPAVPAAPRPWNRILLKSFLHMWKKHFLRSGMKQGRKIPKPHQCPWLYPGRWPACMSSSRISQACTACQKVIPEIAASIMNRMEKRHRLGEARDPGRSHARQRVPSSLASRPLRCTPTRRPTRFLQVKAGTSMTRGKHRMWCIWCPKDGPIRGKGMLLSVN